MPGHTLARPRATRRRIVAGLVASMIVVCPAFACAQRVPVRHYTVSDGLASNQIHAIMQDSLGYLWFTTGEGLSRFDGYAFVSYGTADGLPHPYLVDITEDHFGHVWVAGAKGGVSRLLERPADRPNGQLFERRDIGSTAASNLVGLIQIDREGRLWSATDDGVYRGTPDAAGHVTFARVLPREKAQESRWFEDSRQRQWLLLDHELFAFSASGVARYGAAEGVGHDWIVAMAEDAHGRLVAANTHALYEFVEPVRPGEPGGWRRLPLALGPQQDLRAALFDRTGRLWIGTTQGILWSRDGHQTEPAIADLPKGSISRFFLDRGGNVWIGMESDGVYRIASMPVASYGPGEGLKDTDVRRVVEDPSGRILFETLDGSVAEIQQHRAVAVPVVFGARSRLGADAMVRDGHGDFWLGTQTGQVFFLPAGSTDFRKAVEVALPMGAAGFVGSPTSLSVDRAGDVWIGGQGNELIHGRVDERGHPQVSRVGLSGHWSTDPIGRVAVDGGGDVWISSFGQLGRIRGGVAEVIRAPGTTETLGRALYVDSRGWLWVGLRYEGVLMSKNPVADVPVFERLTIASGLSSNTVRALTEDRRGRIYFGTARALDRFDPVTGDWWRLTIEDGLAGAPVMTLMTDREGRVWAGTSAGLTVYDAEAIGAGQAASPVLLTHIRIDGREHVLPERGTAMTALVDLSAGSRVQFEFVSVANGGGRAPRYQYQLEGGDHEWSPPTTDRSVTYARLAPGGYRFLVRAIGADGRTSEPAIAAFTIPAPIWRRPWFVGLGILATLGAGAAVQRVRLRQVLAMERIRRQVALDLHDDIGSGLSQIAIMSDAGHDQAAAGPWAEVGTLARDLRESMSDIVWAVDPRHDSLNDLVRRMRQVSLQMLEADGVTVTFESPAEAEIARLTLAPDRRRHVLLILKEAVHNVARHAAARTVRITVRVTPARLDLAIADDGRGFDVEAAHDGHGLVSLRARAAALGADLHLDSTRDTGTTIRLSLPLS